MKDGLLDNKVTTQENILSRYRGKIAEVRALYASLGSLAILEFYLNLEAPALLFRKAGVKPAELANMSNVAVGAWAATVLLLMPAAAARRHVQRTTAARELLLLKEILKSDRKFTLEEQVRVDNFLKRFRSMYRPGVFDRLSPDILERNDGQSSKNNLNNFSRTVRVASAFHYLNEIGLASFKTQVLWMLIRFFYYGEGGDLLNKGPLVFAALGMIDLLKKAVSATRNQDDRQTLLLGLHDYCVVPRAPQYTFPLKEQEVKAQGWVDKFFELCGFVNQFHVFSNRTAILAFLWFLYPLTKNKENGMTIHELPPEQTTWGNVASGGWIYAGILLASLGVDLALHYVVNPSLRVRADDQLARSSQAITGSTEGLEVTAKARTDLNELILRGAVFDEDTSAPTWLLRFWKVFDDITELSHPWLLPTIFIAVFAYGLPVELLYTVLGLSVADGVVSSVTSFTDKSNERSLVASLSGAGFWSFPRAQDSGRGLLLQGSVFPRGYDTPPGTRPHSLEPYEIK